MGHDALSDDKTDRARTSVARNHKKTTKDMSDSDLGQALRSVYQRAINEDIPTEMLDLLGKLD